VDDLALLWLFLVVVQIIAAVVVVLALGVVYGVAWLLWRCGRAVVRRCSGGKVESDVVTIEVGNARVSRRVRQAGEQRLVRVQTGLVPASTCVAQRDSGRMDRRRQKRARFRDE
jgi:hypothetical protein